MMYLYTEYNSITILTLLVLNLTVINDQYLIIVRGWKQFIVVLHSPQMIRMIFYVFYN